MITLYDIPLAIPDNAWTPNGFKVRSVLNFKRLPYKNEWVEYPDIEDVCKSIGALPTDKILALDGSGLKDYYTLPAIYDTATGKAISDSHAIAEYLEDTYPNSPRIFPPGSRAAIALFNHFVLENFAKPLTPLMVPTVQRRLNEKSQGYFLHTREYWFEQKLSELTPPGPKRDQAWTQVKTGLTRIASFYERNDVNDGENSTFFIGNTFTYADIIMGSFLNWPKTVLFKEDFVWDDIANANGGIWGRIVRQLEGYREVV